MQADVNVTNHGSVFTFTLETETAREWVHEYVYLEPYQWTGRFTFAVDHRFAGDLAQGMIDDGLGVQ